jgi:hypothetical protein
MQQISFGNFQRGQVTNRTAFNIDNDAFPKMYNFYSWRGRALRKRGTLYLGQLTIQVQSAADPTMWQFGAITLTLGEANLLTFAGAPNSATIQQGSISLTDTTTSNIYTESSPPNGSLVGAPSGSGTINYATGEITIVGGGSHTLVGKYSYYPGLAVMGLRDFSSTVSPPQYPFTLAFDTIYSYQTNQSGTKALFHNTTYYKATGNPFYWNGQNYQQFWTTNYPSTTSNFSGSLWATNGNPGFHFVIGTYSSETGTANITFVFTVNSLPYTTLIIGDQLWFNEWTSDSSTINGKVGIVSNISGASTGTYVVTFTGNQTVGGTGIAQTLTNSTLTITGQPQDGIRWYDGDPAGLSGIPSSSPAFGWVNFSPPLTATAVSIDSSPLALYYLVGAVAIVGFKDRLLFFGPYIQSSGLNGSSGTVIQLQDTALWSWNGTPYYTTPVPFNQTADMRAYYVDQTGFAGYLPAGISNPITTVSNNEDVLLIGFGGDGRKTRFVYTGNDLQPFLFFNINSELPSSSTFSSVALDKGMLDIGQYGLTMTDQQSSQRVDLDIPDNIFQIQALNNGVQRVNAIRDFLREWVYFTYPVNYDGAGQTPVFPTQTLLFNYRDNTWAVLYENYTTHGRYRPNTETSWATLPYNNWSEWTDPWNYGGTSALYPSIIAGNPQGYVLTRDDGTNEAVSGTISAITNSSGSTKITSYNHCVLSLNPDTGIGDYIYIQNCLGTTSINNMVGRVIDVVDANNFVIDLPFPSGTYLGLGQFARLSQPILQTKQFQFFWNEGRQVVLGVQKYLLDKTANSQVTLNIYLNQDSTDAWNNPDVQDYPSGLIYSQILFTCPESTNLGLTPANVNLQTPTAVSQDQIWHRFNTSLVGDSFQLGITLSDAQMRNFNYATSEIVLHGIQLSILPGPDLA